MSDESKIIYELKEQIIKYGVKLTCGVKKSGKKLFWLKLKIAYLGI